MVSGRLVALDTPSGLKTAHVPGRILAIRTTAMTAIAASLRDRPGVLAVQNFGSGLRVRVDPGRVPDGSVRNLAAGIDPDAEFESAEASLDDVFHAVIEGGGR